MSRQLSRAFKATADTVKFKDDIVTKIQVQNADGSYNTIYPDTARSTLSANQKMLDNKFQLDLFIERPLLTPIYEVKFLAVEAFTKTKGKVVIADKKGNPVTDKEYTVYYKAEPDKPLENDGWAEGELVYLVINKKTDKAYFDYTPKKISEMADADLYVNKEQVQKMIDDAITTVINTPI